MTIKEFLVSRLYIPDVYLSELDVSTIKGLKVGVPTWRNLDIIATWASDQAEEAFTDKKIYYKLLKEYCLIHAVEGFDKQVLAEPDYIKMFSEETFCEMWASNFEEVGNLYNYGESLLDVDCEKALYYYKKAAQISPYPEYYYELIGDVYYFGVDSDPDYQKALEYYLLSKNNESLGDYYSEGEAVTPDYAKAIEYYLKELDESVRHNKSKRHQGDICDKLVKCYEAIGDRENAEKYAEQSIKCKK